MPIIEVDHVTKEFQLGELEGLKTTLRNQWRRVRGLPPEERARFTALDDVSFTVEPGEVVGIIGHNGAGKSTLLKMLAGITMPTSGRVSIHGRVAPLIEVSAGFVGQLTGRENVYLNGAILGMTKEEVERKFDEIVEFAGIGEFIDTPVKRYSSGMRVKLAFSVATSVTSEILIVDEVLAVGDLAFQRKCFERMDQLIHREKRTILFVSHNIRQVERICSRVMMLDRGRIVEDGTPAQVCSLYFNANNARHAKERAAISRPPERMSDDLSSCEVDLGTAGKPIPYGSGLDVRIRFNAVRPLRNVVFAVTLHTGDYVRVAVTESQQHPRDMPVGPHEVMLSIPRLPLLPGVYAVRLWIGTSAGHTIYVADHLAPFNVESNDFGVARLQDKGFVALDGTWHLPVNSEAAVEDAGADSPEVAHGNVA